MIDIVINTLDRVELLSKTIHYILDRTRTPYALHVINDGSKDETMPFLFGLWRQKKVETLVLRNKRHGRMAGRNVAAWLAFSDPFVLVDDDILCPDLPGRDWLSEGFVAMGERPNLGILALNHPGALRKDYRQDNKVTYCEVVGNTFMFVRRSVIEGWHHPHYRENFGVIDEHQKCSRAREMGLEVGYLTNVYCYHMGRTNADGSASTGPFLEPKNWETLEP